MSLIPERPFRSLIANWAAKKGSVAPRTDNDAPPSDRTLRDLNGNAMSSEVDDRRESGPYAHTHVHT